jgi:hypothetical protein
MVDQLIKIIAREMKGPRPPDRCGTVSGRDTHLDSPWARRGGGRDKVRPDAEAPD